MGGISFTVGVVFVVLKLVGVIDWSWLLVTLPFWFGIVTMLIIFGGAAGVDAISNKRSE